MKRVTKASLLLLLLIALFVQTAFAEMPPPKLNQVQQDGALLQMYVGLTNELGDPVVNGFGPNQFNIRMDDTEQLNVDSAIPFIETGMGVHYVFAVDVSKPVNRMMADVRNGMSAFVDGLNENDAVSILTFGTDVKILTSHNTDKAAIKEIIGDLSATEMDTVLYKGTYDAVRQAAKYGGRSAVIVITDGKDDPGKNNAEIQQKYTKDSIFESVKSAQVPLYCIGMTDNNDVDAESLAEFAYVTGGDQYLIPASQTITKLNTIQDMASNVIVLYSTLTNEEGKTNNAERHAFRVDFNGVNSNMLEQDISWAAVPTPSAPPAPKLTLTLDDTQFKPMPGMKISFNGMIEYEGDVREEDLVVLVNDEAWELQTHQNGDGQYTFTATGIVPESAQNVMQVRAAMRDNETASRSVSMELATPTPAPTATPEPTATPAPKLTLTLTDTELMVEPDEDVTVRGVIDIEGKVSAEDLILYVNDEVCQMKTWANGDNQYSFSASSKASKAKRGVLEVKVGIGNTDFSSIIQKLALVTPTPAPTATPEPTATPAPKLTLTLTDTELMAEPGEDVTVRGVIDIEGKVSAEDLVLYVNDEVCQMEISANGDNQYSFSASSKVSEAKRGVLEVKVGIGDTDFSSIIQKLTLVTPTPAPTATPKPQLLLSIEESEISVNSGSAKTITGVLQVTGPVDTDKLVLLVNDKEWSMKLLSTADNQYTFSSTGMLENMNGDKLNVMVSLKDESIYSLPQKIIAVTPTPVPRVSPTPPVIENVTEAPTVPPRQTAPSMTVVVEDDEETDEATIIQKALNWLEAKNIPIYVPIGAAVLIAALVIVLIIVVSRKKQAPVVEGTSKFDTNKTGYNEANPTVRGEDDEETRMNDDEKPHEERLTDTVAIGQGVNGNTVHLGDMHTVRIDDEVFEYGATVRLENENTLDVRMEIRQSGNESETRLFSLTKDEAFVLGRKEQVDMVVNGDKAISGSHIKLLYDGTDLYVEDMYSTNGTKLNGNRILPEEKNRVADGDIITIGETQISLHFSL